MINSNANAFDIPFPNSYDSLVPDLVSERLMASIPFVSRCRLVDFVLSSMANCGIDNIFLIIRRNYHSLVDHLGLGREWNLIHKSGGLNLVPPSAEKTVSIYNGRVEALASVLDFLKEQKEKYMVMADTNLTVNFNFNTLIQAHTDSRADITVTYREEPLPGGLTGHRDIGESLYYAPVTDNGYVIRMYMNPKEPGVQNFSMNICITDRELLTDQINTAYVRGQVFLERDILAPQIRRLNAQAFRYDGYVAQISSMKSYFDENIKMLDDANVGTFFFAGNPICTKIHDDNSSRYINGLRAVNIMTADGCITGDGVENSILSYGVKIGMGAGVRNCAPMQDTVIEAGASVGYAVVDRNVTITEGEDTKSTDTPLVYVAKYQVVQETAESAQKGGCPP